MKNIFKIALFCIIITNSLFSSDQLLTIKEKGEIVVGVTKDVNLFGFKSRQGKIIGFDIDLARYIAKELNVKLKLVTVSSNNKISKLLNNNVDILISSLVHTIKKDEKIDFSISYFFDGQSILVKQDNVAKSFKNLDGKNIGAMKNSEAGSVVEIIQPTSKVVYFKNQKNLIKALKNNTVDAITGDFTFLKAHQKKSSGQFKIIGKPFTLKPIGIGLKENQSNLTDAINNIIQTSVKSGKYDEIYKKWFQKLPIKRPILWP
jgi:polar amino acid transport system substrate-binding protein